MAKLVDAPDLGSGAARRVGSIPIIRTKALDFQGLFLFYSPYFLYLLSNKLLYYEVGGSIHPFFLYLYQKLRRKKKVYTRKLLLPVSINFEVIN